MNALFPGLNVPETDRTDIVQALLRACPGLNQQTGQAAVDTLKINLGTPPTPTPNRFGVLGGDTAGFPNGRRLTDDVTDIDAAVVGGFLKGNKLPARRRRRPERQAVPVHVPVPRRADAGLRLADQARPSRPHAPVGTRTASQPVRPGLRRACRESTT